MTSDPKANVVVPDAYFTNCLPDPHGSACYATLESMLNTGRATVGKPPYKFFAHFTTLTPREQLPSLINQDRGVYGLPVIVGMNSTLQDAANLAALSRVDPTPVSSVAGYRWQAFGSNVFSTSTKTANPLIAYFDWMYADGPGAGGTNTDCKGASPHNCWIHRHNTLIAYPSKAVAVIGIGLAATTKGTGATELVEAFPSTLAVPTVPTVIAVSPTTGPHTGGTAMTVEGYGFRSVRSVTLCGAPATSVAVRSISRITLKTGRISAAKACNVVVRTSGGLSVSSGANYFKYS